MKLFSQLIFLLGIIGITAFSCNKEKNDTLPPETQEGRNTFGCLSNGEVWINKGFAPFPSPNLSIDVFTNEFKIVALRSVNNQHQSITINIKHPLSQGKYDLNSYKRMAEFIDDEKECHYLTDSISSKGSLEITKFDTIYKIVSGRFSFTAYKKIATGTINGACDSTVNITDGRFDLKYSIMY